MKSGCIFFGMLVALLPVLFGCDKEPEIIIQKEIVHDTLIVVDTVTLIETVFQTIPDTATTFILVRHAETTGAGTNPVLSSAGQSRAQELKRILSNVDVDAVYSTDFNRTRQTAEPVATANSLSTLIYDPFATDALINQVLNAYPKGIVLIVGHSNTTPALLNAMVGANTYPDFPETEYDNLFVVHVSEKGDATVIHMKYGE
ncbi:MAG TPA: phosphoglycerate mutase family protein [Saprospiraceae bacterium]|nr:phosphoglycerate mutase family protein [Saprospiraceae bacterium]